MSEGDTDILAEAKELSNQLRKSLPSGFEIADVSITAKIPFKALSWKGALLHRASALASHACEAYESELFIPSCLTARALMETAGMVFWVHRRIAGAVKSGQMNDIDDFLMRGVIGDKEEVAEEEREKIEALNAMTAVDHTSKEYEGFREMYDGLSEYVHPNWLGTMGAYGYEDRANMRVQFGEGLRELPWTFIPAPIVLSLLVVRGKRQAFDDVFPNFVELCESVL